MKPTPSSPAETSLLVFGAHPDDIEFGCGAVIAKETQAGRAVHWVVCSKGESATHGTPAQRVKEAKAAAKLLGATIEFADLGGDAHFEVTVKNTLKLAALIRKQRPAMLLAPSMAENQHPDHFKLGRLVRDAARLARYGGVRELQSAQPHAVGQVLFYAVTPEAEPANLTRFLVDVSEPALLVTWRAAMEAHASQVSARNYVELQITRARLWGVRAGVGHAVALWANDTPVLESLAPLGRGARKF